MYECVRSLTVRRGGAARKSEDQESALLDIMASGYLGRGIICLLLKSIKQTVVETKLLCLDTPKAKELTSLMPVIINAPVQP